MDTVQYPVEVSNSPDLMTSADDLRLVEALRRGDETAFVMLVDQYHMSLVRLALLYVPSREVAEEVAQETWVGVLQGLPRFEGRSSLKTWMFQILTNRAKTRGQREGRTVPFSALGDSETEPGEPAVDPGRFLGSDHPRWPGHWASPPRSWEWENVPEAHCLSQETFAHLQAAIAALPPTQRAVLTLRDIEGWTTAEICNVFGISETNLRVLLHRARSKVRRALEQYFDEEERGSAQ